jgi:hypothetical protein
MLEAAASIRTGLTRLPELMPVLDLVRGGARKDADAVIVAGPDNPTAGAQSPRRAPAVLPGPAGDRDRGGGSRARASRWTSQRQWY